MQHVYFIFGKTPELSRAELYKALDSQNINWEETHRGQAYSVLSVSCGLADLPQLQKRLGGTVKTGVILETIPVDGKRETAIQQTITADFLRKLLDSGDHKTPFGWSLYAENSSSPKRLAQKLYRYGLDLKRQLKKWDYRAAFVTAKTHELSSVAVTKEHMLDQGAELCIFLHESEILIGHTKTVQDFKGFSNRDYGRPGRDDLSGMLPPKLALMMINLAGVSTNATLLDPFCGSGTILTEALGIGMKHLIGADISDKAISDTQQNIEWTIEKLGLNVENEISLYVQDTSQLDRAIESDTADAVVTEPYLGPPLRGNERPERMQKNLAPLQELYQQWIQQLHQVLKPSGRLVMVVPHFVMHGKTYSMKLDFSGFDVDHFDAQTLQHGGLKYHRPDQHVIREIVVATKT